MATLTKYPSDMARQGMGSGDWRNCGPASSSNAYGGTGSSTSDGRTYYRTLLDFDISSIPSSAKISSATLRIYCTGGVSSSISASLACRLIKSSWTSARPSWGGGSLSGNYSYDYLHTTISPSLSLVAKGTYTFNVTSLLQQWVSNQSTVYGICIVSTGEKTNSIDGRMYDPSEAKTMKYFANSLHTSGSSVYPLLTVTYTTNSPPGAPGNPRYGDDSGASGTGGYHPHKTAVFKWNKSSDADGNLAGYYVQPKTSPYPFTSWSNDGAEVYVSGANTLSYSHDISKYEPGRYFHFLVRARDSEGAVSGYVGPQNGFRKNQLPPAASIVFPPNNAITYRKNPRFAVKYGTEPEGDPQITQITINGVSSYQAASPNPGWWDIQGSSGTGYLPPGPGKTSMCTWGVALGYGTYEATIQNSDRSDWASTQQTRKITILEPVWTPATQGSILQADHILELRNALDNIFTYYGASPITWAHPSNVYSGITLAPSEAIAAIQELRDAIHTLAVYLNITTESSPMTVPTWTDSSITTLKAIHITEMQQMIPQL